MSVDHCLTDELCRLCLCSRLNHLFLRIFHLFRAAQGSVRISIHTAVIFEDDAAHVMAGRVQGHRRFTAIFGMRLEYGTLATGDPWLRIVPHAADDRTTAKTSYESHLP